MVHFKSYQSLLHTVITGVVKTSTPREPRRHRDELSGAGSVGMATQFVLTVTVGMVVVVGGGWRREESFGCLLPVWACLHVAMCASMCD